MQSPVPGILETPVDKALETWSVRVNTALRRKLKQGLPRGLFQFEISWFSTETVHFYYFLLRFNDIPYRRHIYKVNKKGSLRLLSEDLALFLW